MELKILNKKEEPLLSRIKVESEIEFESATPSEKEVKSGLAKTLGKDEKLLDIKGIYTLYGLKKAKVLCYAYENEEILKRIKIEGRKSKEKKEGAKEEGKKEEKTETKQDQKEDKEKKPQENTQKSKISGVLKIFYFHEIPKTTFSGFLVSFFN